MRLFALTAELITLFTGLWCLWRQRPIILVIVLSLTILTILNEWFFIDWSYAKFECPTNIGYNFYSCIEMLAWWQIFRQIFTGNRMLKILARLTFPAILLCAFAENLLVRGVHEFHMDAQRLFAVAVIIFSLAYFYVSHRRDGYRAQDDYRFWICAAGISFNTLFFINLTTMSDRIYLMGDIAVSIYVVFQNGAILLYHLFICLSCLTYSCRSPKRVRPNLF